MDLGGGTEEREGREEDEAEEAEAEEAAEEEEEEEEAAEAAEEEGWLFDAVVTDMKSEVLLLRLRFICRSPKIIEEPTVCTVMAPA